MKQAAKPKKVEGNGGASRKAPSHGVRRLSVEKNLGEELDARTTGLMSPKRTTLEAGTESNSEKTNPLLTLSEEERAKLFIWLRECPYDDAVRHVLKDRGLGEVSSAQLMEFFQDEAEQHWEKRIERAALEANALVQLVEKSPVKFSSGILAALGQEAFRQIASGQVEPESMGKIATLFLKARSDERADQMQELKREKARRDLQGQVGLALEKLAEEVDKHPMAREAFEALRKEIQASIKNEEEA